MIPNPTPQQQRAISLHGPNLIVSAAAGSGKTAVMIDRAVKMLEEGLSVDKLLMVTFTNAAASQMRQRIARELLERSVSKKSVSTHLSEQAELIDTADICTIDSFCLRLVRRYFHLVDVDPLFAIAGAGEQTVLRRQALLELLDECFEQSSEDFLLALEVLCDHREERLMDLILRVYEYSRTSADPDGWLAHAVELYQGGDSTEALLNGELEYYKNRFMQAARLCRQACDYIESHRGPGGPVKMTQTLSLCASSFASLSTLTHPDDAFNILSSIALPAKNARHARLDESLFAPVAETIDAAKELCLEAKEHPLFSIGHAHTVQSLLELAEPMNTLKELIGRFSNIYSRLKSERNLLDFSDVEHCALSILQNETVAQTLQNRYDCVFVDEYQDTNDLQESILQKLAKPGSLFCVGDVKQSIYAFRHAEPAIFLRRYQRSQQDCPKSETLPEVRLDLNTNFRSTKNILHFTNEVFFRAMTKEHGGLEYDKTQALQPGLSEEGMPIDVRLIIRDKDDQLPWSADGAETHTEIQREALVCAQRIRELLNLSYYDGKTWRRYRYEDITILLRQLKSIGPDFISSLMAYGIPVTSSVNSDVLNAQETGAMLALLKVIDNARDDLAMLTALRSPAALLSASDLAHIRAHDKSLPFALAAQSFAQSGTGESAQKVRRFFENLTKYRALSQHMRVDRLLSHIYADTNALTYYALLPDGEQKVENLWALWLSAQTFARMDDGSLYGFLQLLKLHSELGVLELSTAPGGSNAVRVMTIHGAKGLEFPAVILPFLHRSLEQGPSSLPLTRQEGIGLPCYDSKTQTRQKSALQLAAQRRLHSQERDEQLRLLYVALTRAKHSLTLLGEGSESTLSQASAIAPQNASSYLGLLLPLIISHPACGALRNALSLFGDVAHASSRIQIQLYDEAMLSALPVSSNQASGYSFAEMSLDEVQKRLHYRYPFKEEASVPGKISVSALNSHTGLRFDPLTLPQLHTDEVLDPAGIGTAVHRAMLKLDLSHVESLLQIDRQLDGLLEKGLLNVAERSAVKADVLLSFFETELGKRLLCANVVLREQPFVLRIPADIVDPLYPSGAYTSMQGIIDCAFLENGAWVLLDYKTNRLPNDGLEGLRTQYQVQMDAYRHALEILTKKPVVQCSLCLLMLREQIDITPGELYLALAQNR